MTLEVTVAISSPIVLAAGEVTRVDRLTIELHQPTGSPPAILIKWPSQPSVTSTDPNGLASVAASVVRVMAEAQARLARIRSSRL
jgi:hypothetical protein